MDPIDKPGDLDVWSLRPSEPPPRGMVGQVGEGAEPVAVVHHLEADIGLQLEKGVGCESIDMSVAVRAKAKA